MRLFRKAWINSHIILSGLKVFVAKENLDLFHVASILFKDRSKGSAKEVGSDLLFNVRAPAINRE